MKIGRAFGEAGRVCFGRFGEGLKFLLAEACLTGICFAPLLFLSDEKLGFLAWLTLPLVILILLPGRMNAAAAMKDALDGGRLCGPRLVETREYGEKLFFALKRVFFVALWGIPLIVMAVEIRIHFSGEIDSFTVLRMIKNDFGGGNQIRGLLVVLGIILGTLLLLAAGCAFHSGARHARAQGDPSLVRGHHGKIMLTWLCALVAILPIIIAVVIVVFRYLPVVTNLNGLLMRTVKLPSTRGTLIILAVGAVLTVPMLPFRSMITAAFVRGLKEPR